MKLLSTAKKITTAAALAAARLAGCGRCAGGAGLALVRGHRGRRSASGVVIWCGAGGADPSRCRRWAV